MLDILEGGLHYGVKETLKELSFVKNLSPLTEAFSLLFMANMMIPTSQQ